MICSTCTNSCCITISDTRAQFKGRRRAHQTGPAALQRSIAGGCQICIAIWECRRLSPQARADWRAAMFHIPEDEPVTYYKIESNGNGIDFTSPKELLYSVEFFPVIGTSIEELSAQRGSWGRAKSTRQFDLMRKWLDECEGHHIGCWKEPPNPPPQYPKRLIDVRGRDGEAVNIIETGPDHISKPYLVLSYCWGEPSPSANNLTLANAAQLRQGIPIRNLPQTIVDAIEVTRQLEIPYLWVDALCIIQNSKADWQDQAAQMADIYSNAHCSLAATHTTRSTDGLFISRSPSLLDPIFVDYNLTDPGKEVYEIAEAEFWESRVDNAPLNRRGWVLQERMLARRTIHFAWDQLLWECNDKEACEQCPNELDRPRRYRDWSLDQLAHDVDPSNSISPWLALVETYTKCQLTVPDDKLVAIGGLAKRFKSIRGGRYVAGFWEADLPLQLVWQVNFKQMSRPERYRAPSWSWAALDGPIAFPRPFGDGKRGIGGADYRAPIVKVRSVEVQNTSGDVYGQVASARLVLHGHLLEFHWKPATEERPVGTVWAAGLDNEQSKEIYFFMDGGNDAVGPELRAYLLPIWDDRYRHIRNVDPGFTYSVWGLVLERVNGDVEAYRRLGVFDCEPQEGTGMNWADLKLGDARDVVIV